MRTIAVTGAAGFIGRNLVQRLREQGFTVHPITRETPPDAARRLIGASDALFHLAGVSRPQDPEDFRRSNCEYTSFVADAVARSAKPPLVVYSSTTKSDGATEYTLSKLEAERILFDVSGAGDATVLVYRLPNVFGKWGRPNYNSAVATFCHNLARGLPIRIDDPRSALSLLYIDDLIEQWLALLRSGAPGSGVVDPEHVFPTTVGAVAEQLRTFAEGRTRGMIEGVGAGLERALYATYMSYLPPTDFSYPLEQHVDARGAFTELLKTASNGQLSFLTAHPGITRGGHYHHSKVEKFVVVAGRARFGFRNIASGERHYVETSADDPAVVETVPGWSHDITNVGDDLLVALVWANERFDPARPDTMAMAV